MIRRPQVERINRIDTYGHFLSNYKRAGQLDNLEKLTLNPIWACACKLTNFRNNLDKFLTSYMSAPVKSNESDSRLSRKLILRPIDQDTPEVRCPNVTGSS
jgi:hypothetical protein